MPRTLVLCLDGTNNSFNRTNTNVVRLFELLKKDDPSQLVYYQAGIGTYSAPGIFNRVGRAVSMLADSATAWFLPAHVMAAYAFLMSNYQAGDKICLFGFSRGAYTVRALAGMLYKVGLLPKDNTEQITFAYSMYKQPDLQHALHFRSTFSRVVDVCFVGVWDTVSSVGLIIPKHLPFTSSNHCIRTFRHAVSLDERRAKFQPNLWHRRAHDSRQASKDPEKATTVVGQGSPMPPRYEIDGHWPLVAVENTPKTAPGPTTVAPKRLSLSHQQQQQLFLSSVQQQIQPQQQQQHDLRRESDVLEVFFAGCHADVGGGGVPDTAPHALSSISLRWMIRECTKAQTGILFDNAALSRAGIPLSTFPALFPSSSPPTTPKSAPASAPARLSPPSSTFAVPTRRNPLSHSEPASPPSALGHATVSGGGGGKAAAAAHRTASHQGVRESIEVPPSLSPTAASFNESHSILGLSLGEAATTPAPAFVSAAPAPAVAVALAGPSHPGPTPTPALRSASIPAPTATPAPVAPSSYHPAPTPVKGSTDSLRLTHSRGGSVERLTADELDRLEALAPLNDQLVKPFWWFLELCPILQSYQDEDGGWHRKLKINMFKGRKARIKGSVKYHISVKYRMDNMDYVPRMRYASEPMIVYVP